ncbi:hypothetical protein HPP_1410 [Hydrangea phyllody phytoplasma]|uniref:Uncharacterized protein n=3 Tax=16SrI (Aster yellows group) TaxID=3042590 RepID=A0ABQ5PSN3_9MOLU|nr:hypothetical protein [Hydrangea phyllody phytoplasma]GFZ75183.1 hypothetical protein HPP_1410 [Hydrangea phyllody phytoplasma]GLH61398.1 hypothetical protein RHYP_3440 [Rhus yellows phytoplasma]GLH61733.1 hypothetical protein HP2P_1400 [Hydrangea phyllody phytoplasma]
MFEKKNLLIVFVCSLIAMLFSLLVFVIVVSKLGYLSFKDVKEPNLYKDIKSPKTQEQRNNKTNQLAQRVAEQVKEQFQLTTLTESQIKEIKDGKIVLSKEQLEAIKGELKPLVDLNFN